MWGLVAIVALGMLPSTATATPTGCEVPVSGLVEHAETDRPWVSITYDEHLGANTKEILDTFDRYRMAGTFFTVGEEAAERPALTRAILRHGNELGNHSYTHPDLTELPDHGYRQYRKTQSAIRSATGFLPCLARPPLGRVDDEVIAAADSLGLTSVRWGPSPNWFETDSGEVAKAALDGIQPGQIIILHQTDSNTEALPAILAGLRERGLRSVRTSVLLGGRFQR